MRSTDQAGRENRFAPFRAGCAAGRVSISSTGSWWVWSVQRCSRPALFACLAVLGTAFTWAKPALRWTRAPYDA
jgi:hypothetical protein